VARRLRPRSDEGRRGSLTRISRQSHKPDAQARDGRRFTLAGASGLCQYTVAVSQSGEKCGSKQSRWFDCLTHSSSPIAVPLSGGESLRIVVSRPRKRGTTNRSVTVEAVVGDHTSAGYRVCHRSEREFCWLKSIQGSAFPKALAAADRLVVRAKITGKSRRITPVSVENADYLVGSIGTMRIFLPKQDEVVRFWLSRRLSVSVTRVLRGCIHDETPIHSYTVTCCDRGNGVR